MYVYKAFGDSQLHKISFEYFKGNILIEIVEFFFYLSAIIDDIVFSFVIFNNLEQIGFVRKLVSDEEGNFSILKLGIVRSVVILIGMSPLLFLNDLFFLRILAGCLIATTIGLFWPVS